jgi:hypothetical protein
VAEGVVVLLETVEVEQSEQQWLSSGRGVDGGIEILDQCTPVAQSGQRVRDGIFTVRCCEPLRNRTRPPCAQVNQRERGEQQHDHSRRAEQAERLGLAGS